MKFVKYYLHFNAAEIQRVTFCKMCKSYYNSINILPLFTDEWRNLHSEQLHVIMLLWFKAHFKAMFGDISMYETRYFKS